MKKRNSKKPEINLFPFLTILLCSMGILAFIGLSLLFSSPSSETNRKQPTARPTENEDDSVTVEVRLIGKPEYITPNYLICKKDAIIIKDSEIEISMDSDIAGYILYTYFQSLEKENETYHEQYQDHEEYVIFLVYPSGIENFQTARQIMLSMTDLNYGIEPLLPNWKIIN